MFRYEPPKSSIWGHALRKMPAARARQLLQSVLDTVADAYCFSGGALSLEGARDYVAEFEALLGRSSQHSRFDGLTEEQCEKCVEEIANDEKLGGGKAGACSLVQSFTITRWKLPGQPVDTPSELSMWYGQGQYLSTTLQFAAIEDFRAVQKVFADIGLGKLNEQHLKAVKERKSKSPVGGG